MPHTFAAAALTLVGSAIYGIIGSRYLALGRASSTFLWFGVFWGGIAAYATLDAGWGLLVPLLPPPLAVGILVLHLKILAASAAFFGLVYYLTYVYTGSKRVFWPLLALYLFTYVLVVYSYAARRPIGQEVREWGGGLVYANPAGPITDIAYALLLVPPLLASLAYVALLPRATSRGQRRRIVATSAAFVVFFGGLLLGWMTDLIPSWPLIEKLLAIGVGLALLTVMPAGRAAEPKGAQGAQAGRPGDPSRVPDGRLQEGWNMEERPDVAARPR